MGGPWGWCCRSWRAAGWRMRVRRRVEQTVRKGPPGGAGCSPGSRGSRYFRCRGGGLEEAMGLRAGDGADGVDVPFDDVAADRVVVSDADFVRDRYQRPPPREFHGVLAEGSWRRRNRLLGITQNWEMLALGVSRVSSMLSSPVGRASAGGAGPDPVTLLQSAGFGGGEVGRPRCPSGRSRCWRRRCWRR